jgi:hypothetical protein
MQGIVMDAADGFALAPYFSYLRETRRLRDPKAEPTPDYRAFAALIATAGPLPQAKDLGARTGNCCRARGTRKPSGSP